MNKSEFVFSIIIPVYNTEKYIEKCLNSVLDAMDTDCEVIIVNDGATDDSEKIIKQFINNLPEKYKENFLYTKKKNKGLADTKNVGIEMARGKFISVVDSDDYIDKNFYKIACGEECFKDQGCTVELSDHTICRLSGEMWMDVMKSGLKAKGYIQNQDIENVIVSAVEG